MLWLLLVLRLRLLTPALLLLALRRLPPVMLRLGLGLRGLAPGLSALRLERAGLRLCLLLRPRLLLGLLRLLGGLVPACHGVLLLGLLLPALHLLLAAGHLGLLFLHLLHVQLLAQDAQMRVDGGCPAECCEGACVQFVESVGGRDERA